MLLPAPKVEEKRDEILLIPTSSRIFVVLGLGQLEGGATRPRAPPILLSQSNALNIFSIFEPVYRGIDEYGKDTSRHVVILAV